MKISVLIPSYNYAHYLPTALDSVFAQTHKDTEIIVVDDGSTDDSRNILEHYRTTTQGKVQAIFQVNQGQGAAFNTGFAHCTGDVIAFLDADDTWRPNKLQRVAETMADPEVIGVMHQYQLIDKNGSVLDPRPIPIGMPNGDLARVVVESGGAWCFAATSGLSYRRSALEKVFPLDQSKWILCADGALAFTTAFLGRIETLTEVLSGYRIHGENNHYQNPSAGEFAKTSATQEVQIGAINAMLERIGSPQHIDLARNLHYRRGCFYARGVWNTTEIKAISNLILHWPFYSFAERASALTRFLGKSLHLLTQTPRAEKNLL